MGKSLFGIFFFVVVVCFFVSCSAVEASNLTKIYAIGDSLTAGNDLAPSYTGKLNVLLGSSYLVVNKGRGGNTTVEMLGRFEADILTAKPDYVIIWGGINDVGQHIPAQSIEERLQIMYTMAHEAGIKVVSVNLIPFKGDSSHYSSERQLIADSVNSWIANSAIDVDYRIDMKVRLEDPQRVNTLLPKYDDGGHLHLSMVGQNFVGENLYQLVDWKGDTSECAKNTCLGNSCWDGIKYTPGGRIENCASGEVSASVSVVSVPSSVYLTWSSHAASKLEAACLSGPVIIDRGAWFLSDLDCRASGLFNACTDKGYLFEFNAKQIGSEMCIFYPINKVDNLYGTPFSVIIKAKSSFRLIQ